MYKNSQSLLLSLIIITASIFGGRTTAQNIYQDRPFLQDYSIKFYTDTSKQDLLEVCADRNGAIRMLSRDGLLQPDNGKFQCPGTIVPDQSYRFIKDKRIAALENYENQFVYLTDSVIFSNAWAGKLFSRHSLPKARYFAGGAAFSFLISDGKTLQLIQDSGILWSGSLDGDDIAGIEFQKSAGQFWILGSKSLYTFTPGNNQLTKVLDGSDFTCFDLTDQDKKVFVGTSEGYIVYDTETRKQTGEIAKKLPATSITALKEIHGRVWFGTDQGAFLLRADGKYDYYYGERWLPGNTVTDIAAGPENSVLVLTTKGLGQIIFKNMTLEEKALIFEEQVRLRHIRNGFSATLVNIDHGNLSTGYMEDSDNDGLWTSMYLSGEVFRYAVTKDPEALQNCRESLDAMERLYTITSIPGFPARSFERSGHMNELSDAERWKHSRNSEWDWKSTTSSDEVIGHIFAFGAMAELIDEPAIKNRAILLIDTLMSTIIKNDLYLIDYDGKPTLWGKWNPDYVNSFPVNVGDRKLNSSNIISMLQTAYHFTRKEKYKAKAFELMTKNGYLQNMMRPMKIIGQAPENASEHARLISDGWNHSDDEMYFIGYWGLYRYAFNDTLQTKFKESIIDHWQIERPEKEGAWNIFTALTGTKDFDLNEAIWYLQEHPLDLIDWNIKNSHRKDIEIMPANFRKQTIKEVLSPNERPVQRHNANMFSLDTDDGDGSLEYSAGDIWLLPYWMGRFLGIITSPQK
ncbi:hypothetical protein [Dyadobacter sediminis]|uniref:Two component regulator propeller n=1 Tax=Dyadobacter sediminis TaxID=1493691 RepID=A0A5R9K8S3_9BACT|nr:hypothetical protein [Dyadobacter sediminis]TLU90400.1 hypothetical protein FEM55_17705 [Dyadobacter sediminis]GGC07475.1 hypothetical protein GCM10011325_37950 [Dyadobacter sediminis]